jgi:DNA-binding transcriptional LysR family regulator
MSGEANCLLGARLQIKLLQRSTPSLALTDLGARYIERCKDVLDAVAEGYSQTMVHSSIHAAVRVKVACQAVASRRQWVLDGASCLRRPRIQPLAPSRSGDQQ